MTNSLIYKKLFNFLQRQLGDIFKEVEPVNNNLWVSKGNTIFVEVKRDKVGMCSWLRKKNFILEADEAGNKIYRLKIKEQIYKQL